MLLGPSSLVHVKGPGMVPQTNCKPIALRYTLYYNVD